MVQGDAYTELKTVKKNWRINRRKIYIVGVDEVALDKRDLKRWDEIVCQYSSVWIIRRPI